MNKTKIIECWEVQRWDGGERHNHHCYVETEITAKEIAGVHDIVIRREFIIHETKTAYDEWHNGKLKEKALAKLTPEERKVLGL